jgi:hypothetical protein
MKELERQLAEKKIEDLSLELDIVNEKYALDMSFKLRRSHLHALF